MIETIPLYRLENPETPNDYDLRGTGSLISHPEILGQWFFKDVKDTFGYISKVVFRYPEHRETSQLVVAKVEAADLNQYLAEHHPIASRMAYNPEDYIVPRDGSVPIETFLIQSLLKKRLRWTLRERMERQHKYEGIQIQKALKTVSRRLEGN